MSKNKSAALTLRSPRLCVADPFGHSERPTQRRVERRGKPIDGVTVKNKTVLFLDRFLAKSPPKIFSQKQSFHRLPHRENSDLEIEGPV
ncbi:MAG TPA: hypothetical protein VK137_00725 [Planctomycetaceae bacterium]|nr:hypothetical protein [Planctomycetaceae bacterium]